MPHRSAPAARRWSLRSRTKPRQRAVRLRQSTNESARTTIVKLYTFPPSPNARKVAAVIAQLRLTDIEQTLIRLQKGEHRHPDYLAINPMGKVPALRDGDLLLWESN